MMKTNNIGITILFKRGVYIHLPMYIYLQEAYPLACDKSPRG